MKQVQSVNYIIDKKANKTARTCPLTLLAYVKWDSKRSKVLMLLRNINKSFIGEVLVKEEFRAYFKLKSFYMSAV